MVEWLLMKNGPYELVKAPSEYPGRTYRGKRRYVYEHHLVWWRNTGEVVGDGFDIHHKNEKKRDNRFSNLERKTHGEHAGEHGAERGTPVELACFTCKAEFTRSGSMHRFKIKIGQTKFFCSRSCQVKQQWIERHSSVA